MQANFTSNGVLPVDVGTGLSVITIGGNDTGAPGGVFDGASVLVEFGGFAEGIDRVQWVTYEDLAAVTSVIGKTIQCTGKIRITVTGAGASTDLDVNVMPIGRAGY